MFSPHKNASTFAALRLLLAVAICLPTMPVRGQQPHSLTFKVSSPGQKLEMVVNSSRIVQMEYKVPRMLVENPSVVKANPLSPTQVQLAALRPGVTHVSLWDEEGQIHTIDVIVMPDARELEYLLATQFPEASLKVRPLASSVAISGYCPSAAMVSRVVQVAEDYFPKVINNMEIGGAQQVLLHVKVLEVSRTKLRTLGVDWALFTDNFDVVSRPSGLITNTTIGGGAGNALQSAGATLAYGIVNGSTSFFSYLEALRRNNLLKVLSEPTLTTVSGRAASFNVGGEFPIIVPQSLGTVSIEYRQFGTRVDFVPIVHGNGSIRLEMRPQVSEIDSSRSVTVANTTIPGLRSRWVDTAAEMRAGQTLALAGLLQNRIETETRSIPVLGDLPGIGAAFRRVQETNNEVELLILVTPELVEPMDKHEAPPCGPGEFTRSPNDHEFYHRGYIEVPKCCNQCGQQGCRGNCRGGAPPMPGQAMPGRVMPGRVMPNQAMPNHVMPNHVMPGHNAAARGAAGSYYDTQRPAPLVTPQQLPPAQPVGNPTTGYRRGGSSGRPGARPGLIGPVGYDEIK